MVDNGIYDVVSVTPGPISNTHFFAGTWNSGVVEFVDNTMIDHYTDSATTLRGAIDDNGNETEYIRVGGLDYDIYGNMWMTNSSTNKPLIKYSGDEWESFDLQTEGAMSGKILCTNNNQYWIQLRKNGLVVAREVSVVNQGVTYTEIESVSIKENDGLESNTVNCFVEDNEGAVWVGAGLGLSVCYLPNNIFNSSSYTAEPVLVETEDGYVEKLFENTEILDIRVDGGNRKWVATKSNGVFLISDDGSETIQHFTKENSPLFTS